MASREKALALIEKSGALKVYDVDSPDIMALLGTIFRSSFDQSTREFLMGIGNRLSVALKTKMAELMLPCYLELYTDDEIDALLKFMEMPEWEKFLTTTQKTNKLVTPEFNIYVAGIRSEFIREIADYFKHNDVLGFGGREGLIK